MNAKFILFSAAGSAVLFFLGIPVNAVAAPATELADTLAIYPIEAGRYWVFETTATRRVDFGGEQMIKSRQTLRFRNITDGLRGRTAVEDREIEIVDYSPRSDRDRPSMGGASGITYLLLRGKIYLLSPLAAGQTSRIDAALRTGVGVMEEWGMLPQYVLPLRIGFVWTDGRERYQVLARGPRSTPAGDFPDCFRIIGKTNDGDVEEWFSPGVGPIETTISNARGTTCQVLIKWGTDR